jgi:hypothetical protein
MRGRRGRRGGARRTLAPRALGRGLAARRAPRRARRPRLRRGPRPAPLPCDREVQATPRSSASDRAGGEGARDTERAPSTASAPRRLRPDARADVVVCTQTMSLSIASRWARSASPSPACSCRCPRAASRPAPRLDGVRGHGLLRDPDRRLPDASLAGLLQAQARRSAPTCSRPCAAATARATPTPARPRSRASRPQPRTASAARTAEASAPPNAGAGQFCDFEVGAVLASPTPRARAKSRPTPAPIWWPPSAAATARPTTTPARPRSPRSRSPTRASAPAEAPHRSPCEEGRYCELPVGACLGPEPQRGAARRCR